MTTILARISFAMLSTMGAASLVIFADPSFHAPSPSTAPSTGNVVAAAQAPANNG